MLLQECICLKCINHLFQCAFCWHGVSHGVGRLHVRGCPVRPPGSHGGPGWPSPWHRHTGWPGHQQAAIHTNTQMTWLWWIRLNCLKWLAYLFGFCNRYQYISFYLLLLDLLMAVLKFENEFKHLCMCLVFAVKI